MKNDYERAIKYSKLAFEGYENDKNIEEKVNSLLSIGNLYADAGDIENTIIYYFKAIFLYDEDKDDIESSQLEKAITLIDLAVILLEKNKLKLRIGL